MINFRVFALIVQQGKNLN